MSDQSSPTHKKAHSSTVTRPVTAIVFLVTFFFTYLNAQTIVPAGLGPMSATQPNRETAILTGNLLRTGGQNPTVKIVWGDEDGEISGKSWDNTVVISTNQVVGSFSTTITIPNQEKIYYFRSVAENAGGTVVSRSLGVLNPSAPVGVADLRGRWSFDDDNFSDPVSPANFDNLQLWLDAADTSTLTVNSSNKVSQWNDKTENEIHAINSNTNNQPTLVANSQNGLSTLQFDGTNDYLIASSLNITQPYSIFAVAKSTAGSGKDYLFDGITNDNTRSLLTLRPNSGTVQIWANGWANSNINSESAFTTFSTIFNSSNSQISVNGMLVSGLSTGTYSLTNGIHLGTNYLANADFLGGNIAEFFIIDGVVNSTDRQKIEAYLARKWGIPLTNSVNSIHAAKDSSGSNYHGILKKKFAPTNLSSTPKLWLDASELSSAGASWSDKSSNGNNAAKTGSPAIISNFQNGNTVMHYTGNGQWHDFSAITDIRTVFWVVSQDSSANGSGFRFLLCGASSSHFHNNNNGKFWGIHAQNNIKSGYTRMDGSVLSGDTNYPNNLSIITLRTIGNVSADRFGQDRGFNGRQWRGKLGEILIYNTALSDAEIIKIEGYLAHKWGLMSNLPNTHPYKLAPPLGTGTPSFTADTPFGNGKAIDLVDGHVEISTGGNEDVFDGNGSFSVSAWVKGWSDDSFAPVISKGGEVPNPKSISSMKLWLDAQDLATMDKGTTAGAIGTPTDGSNVKYWADKSGNGHHATASASPSYHSTGLWDSYPAVNNSGGQLTLTNSATSFDAWNSMSLIFVYKWASGGWNWEENIKKGNGFLFGKRRIENQHNQGFRLATGDFRSDGITRANVEPKIVCFTYDGVAGKMNWHANGSSAGTRTSNVPGAFNSSSSDSVVFMNRMQYGEIFIFRNALSDTERQTIESHLATKWGMTGKLPATHLFNTQNGWSVGRRENENTLITNIKGTGEIEEASHSTALSTDNQWHHIVSTYDGGTRKIYLDGTEVSSASASGSVASTTATLLLGASDMNDTAGTVAAAKHSGIKLDEVRFYSSGLSSTQVAALYNFGKGDIGNIGEFATLPAKISGTTGTALSTTVTAAFPNAYYEAVNLTPGLSINNTTGQISGTPTVGGVGSITVIARNAAGKRAVTTIPYDSNPTSPLLSFPTLSPGSDHAVILAEVTDSGGVDNSLDLFWGNNDGNQTADNWDSNATPLGMGIEGFYGTTISGLTAGETYYYRIRIKGGINPKSVSGSNLKIWMDAEDSSSFQLSGSEVVSWESKSGESFDFNQKTGNPTRIVVNGKNVVNFDGNDQLWTNAAFTGTNFSILSVARWTGGGNGRLIASKDRNWLFGYHSGGNDRFYFEGWVRIGGSADTNWNLHAATMNSSDQANTWTNFVQTTTNANGAHNSNYAPSKLSFGAHGNLGEPSKGEIAELLVFDSVLPTSDRQKIEGYLAYKWGLTNSLPNDHPYKTVSPNAQVPTTSVSLGQKPMGAFTGALSSLQSGTTYKYRFAATNPGGVDISAIKTFTTLGLPQIETPGATEITKTSATLNAKLTFTNGNDSNVTFYWGDNNGSTTAENWDHNYAISGSHGVGVVPHSVSSGLTTGTTYYYTAKAVNAQGTAWATVKTFVPANTAINKYSIPDLALWLDATDLDGNGAADSVANGSALPSWTDKSVTPKTVNQTSSTEQPIVISNAIGSRSVVRFDGNGDVLNVSSIRTAAGAYSIYALTQRISESGDTSAHLISEPTWALIPSTTADSYTAKVAKQSAGSGKTLTNIKLGKSSSSTTNDFGGDLAELLIFSRQLTNTEEQKVEGYLAHKWGVANTLDANHTYHDVPPVFNNKPLITKSIKIIDIGETPTAWYPLHASIFTGYNTSSTINNIGGATYAYSPSRVFTGNIGILNTAENSAHNIQLAVIDEDVLNWNKFPTFSGGDNFHSAFSGSFYAPVSGTYNFRWDCDDRGGMYVDLNGDGMFSSTESVAPWAWYGNGDLSLTQGTIYNFFYMTAEGGGGDTNNWYITQPGEVEERVNFGKTSQINMWKNPTKYAMTTGQPVSIQIPATRNPTSWNASGLPSGLSINNSGIISGISSYIGDFNATVTAINSDGNDSKIVLFRSSRGQRIIDWNQTFAGITYGDQPITLNGTATGSDLNTTNLPGTISGLKLWLDAANLTSTGANWTDNSGNGNHATKSGSPSVISNAQNGLSIMRYSGGDGDYHEWTDLNDIRTIFWVIKAESTNGGFLLGDDNRYDFHNNSGNPPNFWHGSHASANVRNGNLSINGTRNISGTSTAINASLSNLSIVNLKTAGNVEASRFSRDRTQSGRNWKGDLGELLIYNTALTDSEINQMEGYLAHKWNLNESLPNNHPYRFSTSSYYTSSNSEVLEVNGNSLSIKSGGAATITLKAPANQSADSATPVTKTISIAKAPLTITAQDLTLSQGAGIPTDLNYTVYGWKHNDASLAIGANPAALSNLALWLDASDSSTITHYSNAVSQWSDKSGNNKHATQSTTASKPTLGTNEIQFDGTDDSLSLAHGVVPDPTEASMVFLVANCDATSGNDGFITNGRFTNRQSFSYRTHGISQVTWYSWGNDLNGVSSSDNSPIRVHALELSVTGNTFRIYHDGTLKGSKTSFSGTTNSGSENGFLGRTSTNENLQGSIREVIIVKREPTDIIRKSIEGYLAHKWGLTSSLPSNHTHKTVSLTRGPIVTTDATQGNAAGTYFVRPSDAASKKYSLAYIDGQLIKSSLTEQTISWGQNFNGIGVGQTVDLNASVGSGLAVLYSVSDTSVAELAVTNQSSLQAWYKLDESSGDAADSSANSNVGSLRNSPAYNAGKFGNAITLDGTNDHIRAYNYPGIGRGDRRTIALWFKTSTANKPLLQYGASGTATLFKLSLNNSGAVVLDLGGTTITSSSASHANGAWHHVAVTIPANGNTGAAKLYVDGSRTNGSGSTAINTTSSVDLVIGRDGTSGSAYFNGQIDDVRFYGAELNSTLIGQLYGNGNGDFNRLTVKTAGTVTITATQPGNNSYAPAPASTITATFDKSDQTIAFTPISDKSVGDFDFSPTAVASSGLDITFTSSDSQVAEIQGTVPNQTIKIRGAGTATITASQGGNGAYNTAPSVTQTVTVGYFNLQANSLPGLRLWLDGNNINGDATADSLANDSAITQWIDQSGNTNNAGQGTANAKPTYAANTLNGMGVVRFTSAQSLDITSSNDFSTVIAVMNQASGQSAETKPLGSNIFTTTSAGKFGMKRQGSAWMDSGISSHSPALITMQLHPGNYALYVNGTNKGSGTDPVAPSSATKVGNDFAGDIAELIAYNTALSEGVRHKVEGYLAHKWGLAGSLPSTHTYRVGKPAFGGAQVLTFQPLSDKQAGQTIALNVSSDSGLSTFSYDSNDSSVVSFSGNVAAALKVGKVTITATQAGQSPWLSATATQPFIVTATPRVDQTITFVDIPNKTVQSSNFDLNATASSGLPVSFAVVSGTSATVESNGTVTITGAGVTTIRASQDGNGSYNPAPTVEKTLTVNKVTQTITFNTLADASLTAGTYELNATASSGLAVSFVSSDNTVAEVSGTTLTLKTGGSITITASQGGNGIYLAAPDATQSLSVIDDTQQAQTITWSQSLGSRAFGVADLNLTASSNANLPITYISSDSSIASIVNGTFLQVVGAGNATITATQAGNGQYQAASAVIKTVTVTKANQTIVTNGGSSTLPNLTMDNGDFEFAPTLQSVKTGTTTATGLALSYASSSSAVIEVTSGGTRLKPKGNGTATITVTQNGDSTYNAASNNNATFTITVTEKSPYSDSLPGMILWLDANDINADGLAESNSDFLSNGSKSQASTWADRSGSSNTLSQGTTNLQPVRVVNSGKPGLAFGSTQGNAGAHMTATMPPILAGNPSFTLFVAVKTAGTQPEKILHFGNSAGTAGQVLGMAKNGGYYFNGGGELSFPSVNFGGNVQVGVFRRKTSATYADGEFFFNGTTQIGSAQSGTSVPAIPSSGTREIILGAGRTGTAAIGNELGNAVMHEVMLFSGSLTDFAIRRMEGYLAHKWGSNARLVAGHPFKANRPLFGGSQSISLNPTNVPTDSSDGVPFMSIFDSAFDLEGAYATSGLALTYESNDSSILSVTSAGLLQPGGQGLVRITARQAGNAYFSAATPVVFNMKIMGKRSQTVTFTTPNEVRIDQPLDLNASASSGLDANFSIVSGGNIASLSGSRLTFSDTGSVTVQSGQAGDSTYAPANPVNRTFLVKRPLKLVFDAIGDMGMGQSFTVKAVVLDGITNKPVPVNPTYSIVSGTATISGSQITCGSSTGTVTVRAVATGTEYFTSSADKTFNVTNKQGQTIFFKQGEKGGLRDLPLSRKPIPIGRMATATSNLGITYSLTANPGNVLQKVGTGADAILVFNKNFTGTIPNAGLTVQITATQAGNSSYNAAASVVREITIKQPGKSAFFDERRLDPRYEKERTKFARKLATKKNLKGLIDLNGDGSVNHLDAELMFDSDDTDSDGDGMSNFMERAFGGDSLSSDAKFVLPRSVNKKDGKQRISFQKYQDSYNSEGIEYIVETSTDLRTWTTTGVTQVDLNGNASGKGMNAGGGMERVLFETSGTAASKGGKQFLRVRLRTK